MPISGSTIIPSLRYHDAHAAIDWLVRVFGFTKHAVFEGPNNTVMHAQLTRGQGMLMLGSVIEADKNSAIGADKNSATDADKNSATNTDNDYARRRIDVKDTGVRETVGLCIIAESDDDCIAIYNRAKAQGVEIVQELTSPEYGGKSFSCGDPEGHIWWLGSYNPWGQHEPEHQPAAEGTA